MADANHKLVFPSQADVTEFLKTIGFAGPDALAKASQLSYHTVAKWYRDEPSEMSAVNLLRVVISAGKEADFSRWLLNLNANANALVNRDTPDDEPPLPHPPAPIATATPSRAPAAKKGRARGAE